jgi:hypothetical protein
MVKTALCMLSEQIAYFLVDFLSLHFLEIFQEGEEVFKERNNMFREHAHCCFHHKSTIFPVFFQ